MIYNWQQPEWPEFSYDLQEMSASFLQFAEETAHVTGMLAGMPEAMRMEAIISNMVAEAVKTSEIEGEYVSRKDVMSSIRNHMGFDSIEKVKDKKAGGAGLLMVDVRNTYKEKLTKEKLFEWHKMLMAGSKKIAVGKWRMHKEPMQVVSGTLGKEKVHFEAPPSTKVPGEMMRFIQWFNDTAPGGKMEIKMAVIRSAVAHLYFETIHPFEDGNGRIGRAIAEKALSQTMGRPVLLSLSARIESDRKAYYNALEKAQRSNEVTAWIKYFAGVTLEAQKKAKELVEFILKKAVFFDKYRDQLNERQFKVIGRMAVLGQEAFEGGMNARKYISIAKVSKATATRDLQYLTDIGVFTQQGGGRSTSYILNL